MQDHDSINKTNAPGFFNVHSCQSDQLNLKAAEFIYKEIQLSSWILDVVSSGNLKFSMLRAMNVISRLNLTRSSFLYKNLFYIMNADAEKSHNLRTCRGWGSAEKNCFTHALYSVV